MSLRATTASDPSSSKVKEVPQQIPRLGKQKDLTTHQEARISSASYGESEPFQLETSDPSAHVPQVDEVEEATNKLLQRGEHKSVAEIKDLSATWGLLQSDLALLDSIKGWVPYDIQNFSEIHGAITGAINEVSPRLSEYRGRTSVNKSSAQDSLSAHLGFGTIEQSAEEGLAAGVAENLLEDMGRPPQDDKMTSIICDGTKYRAADCRFRDSNGARVLIIRIPRIHNTHRQVQKVS